MTSIDLFDGDVAGRGPDGLLGAVEWYGEQLQGPLEVAEALLDECDRLGSASTEADDVALLVARLLGHLREGREWAASFAALTGTSGRFRGGVTAAVPGNGRGPH